MINLIYMFMAAAFEIMYNKLTNIYTSMVHVLKRKDKKWEAVNIRSIVNHCLYNHEMENVPFHVNFPTRLIVITVAALVILRNANKRRSKSDE